MLETATFFKNKNVGKYKTNPPCAYCRLRTALPSPLSYAFLFCDLVLEKHFKNQFLTFVHQCQIFHFCTATPTNNLISSTDRAGYWTSILLWYQLYCLNTIEYWKMSCIEIWYWMTKGVILSASVSQYTCSMLVVPRSVLPTESELNCGRGCSGKGWLRFTCNMMEEIL